MEAAVLEEPSSSEGDSSAISKTELSREEISEAFLFILVTLLGREDGWTPKMLVPSKVRQLHYARRLLPHKSWW